MTLSCLSNVIPRPISILHIEQQFFIIKTLEARPKQGNDLSFPYSSYCRELAYHWLVSLCSMVRSSSCPCVCGRCSRNACSSSCCLLCLMPRLVHASIYGNTKVSQERIFIKFFLNFWPKVHHKFIRPATFGEKLVSQKLWTCGSVIWIQSEWPLRTERERERERERETLG